MRLMQAMEASTFTDGGNFHVFPWKLRLTYIEVNLVPPTSMENFIPIDVNLLPPTSMAFSMRVSGKVHRDRSKQ